MNIEINNKLISEIDTKLNIISEVFNIDKIINKNIDSNLIKKYYTISNLGYKYLHSREGAVHMALNYDGVFNKDGYYGQANIIKDYLDENQITKVLELASGKGFNSSFLAKNYPNIHFYGIDLTPKHVNIAKKINNNQKNLEFKVGDFESIPFDNSTFNLIFEIESICHASNMNSVFNEVSRVILPKGYFISFDGFHSTDISMMDKKIQVASKLVEITMAVNKGLKIQQFLNIAETNGFIIRKCENISYAIIPNLQRFERMAKKFFAKKLSGKIMKTILPNDFIQNVIAGYLMVSLVKAGIQGYYLSVFERKE